MPTSAACGGFFCLTQQEHCRDGYGKSDAQQQKRIIVSHGGGLPLHQVIQHVQRSLVASLVTVAFADKAVCDTLLAGHESRIAWGQIRHEIRPVHRFLVRDIGIEHGDSERAAELPGQIDQPRCLGDLRASDRRKHDEVDWGEQKAQPQAAL